jgi:uncharacterized protein (DUF1015 family)
MAEIKPIRAWRYNDALAKDIENLTSPLFDVVTEKQRAALYRNPFNSVHLSVPAGDNPSTNASQLLNEWKSNGTIKQDIIPGIYVYYQYFRLQGMPNEICRKGFICHIRAYDWEEGVILRHENTIPKAVNDRIELLEKTELHASPTHGLYTDEKSVLEKYMDEAIQYPILETEDYQGVRDVLAIIQDIGIIKKFIEVLADKKIILADGHHRYESSLAYKHKRLSADLDPSPNKGYNYHLMYLTNTETGGLRILPTHRLIKNLPDFDEHKIIQTLSENFIIKPIEDPDTINEIIIGKPWAFGLIFKNICYKVRLKPEGWKNNPWPFPDSIKKLDLTVMHYFIIEKALGIRGADQRKSQNIDFDRSFGDCLAKVILGDVQMAIITQEVTIDDVKLVCESGYTMPQKSTYFYPKAICGFLFSSIKEEEFFIPEYIDA